MRHRCFHCRAEYSSQVPVCRCGARDTVERVQRTKERPKTIRASEHAIARVRRASTSLPVWDDALGGGFVLGSSMLLGGDPGVGKTTQAMRVAGAVARATKGDALYLSSEMPVEMVIRAGERGGADLARILVRHERELDAALREIAHVAPSIVVWDSVQMFSAAMRSREADLFAVLTGAVDRGGSMILISHVTKDGDFALPKTAEHVVDTTFFIRREVVTVAKSRFCEARSVSRDVKKEQPIVGR